MKEKVTLAEALVGIQHALIDLGNAGAATPMGAIEAFGLVVKETGEAIASALSDIAAAIREHGEV